MKNSNSKVMDNKEINWIFYQQKSCFKNIILEMRFFMC